MRRYIAIAFAVLIGLGISVTSVEAREKAKITIKMATIAPRGSSFVKVYEEFEQEVRNATNNEVGFKIYWGGVQGEEKDVVRKIRLKQLHGGGFMGTGLGLIVPEVRVTEIPYMFMNYDEVHYVRSKLEDRMNRYFDEAGFVVLGWIEVGFIYSFSKVPITSLEIARKQKWWSLDGDPIGKAIFKALDISPIPLSISDVATSLSTNLIDTASSTPYGALAFQWHTRFKYMSEYPTTHILGASVITKEIWNKISPESKGKIMEIAKGFHDKFNRTTKEENARSIELLKQSGISVVSVDIDNEQMQFILDASKRARESLVGTLYPQELLDQTLSYLDEYRKAHPNNTLTKIR
ncbi:MAG: TRAP transporter substrate-binding protein DctP [Deltaproteobacteria bacterium]|nr:TRAP transporter substrate-binding protein DctP [Deltaproteobacteria bacterium]